MKKALILLCLFFFISPFAVHCREDEDTYYTSKGINDNLMLTAGFYLPSLSTNIRLDSQTLGQGTEFSFEDTLDMESSLMVFRVDGHLRISRWLSLEFGYYNISRDTTTTLNDTIQFGNDIYTVNADINALFKTQVLKGALQFSLINDGKVEFGFSLGANIIFLDVELNSIMADINEKIDEIAPLPLIGAHLYLTIAPGIFFKGNFQYFTLAIQDIDGSALDFRGAVEYYPLENIGIGAGFNLFSFNLNVQNIEVENKDVRDMLSGKFDYSYIGLVVYIAVVL